jgi:hypothetical protein
VASYFILPRFHRLRDRSQDLAAPLADRAGRPEFLSGQGSPAPLQGMPLDRVLACRGGSGEPTGTLQTRLLASLGLLSTERTPH